MEIRLVDNDSSDRASITNVDRFILFDATSSKLFSHMRTSFFSGMVHQHYGLVLQV
jgi:hypothetical protein